MENNFGIIVVDKAHFSEHGLLNVIHYIGFPKPPSDEDFEKVEAKLKADEDFNAHINGREWFLMPTAGLMVMIMNIIEGQSNPAFAPPPNEPEKPSLILPFGNPNETPKIIMP